MRLKFPTSTAPKHPGTEIIYEVSRGVKSGGVPELRVGNCAKPSGMGAVMHAHFTQLA
jgi:hypothetical protein